MKNIYIEYSTTPESIISREKLTKCDLQFDSNSILKLFYLSLGDVLILNADENYVNHVTLMHRFVQFLTSIACIILSNN